MGVQHEGPHWLWRPGVRASLGLEDDLADGDVDLRSMRRDVLNEYAGLVGISNPQDFKNKTELIAAIEAL